MTSCAILMIPRPKRAVSTCFKMSFRVKSPQKFTRDDSHGTDYVDSRPANFWTLAATL